MTITVQCPKCRAKLRGPESMAGKSVRCAGCREKFRVPVDTATPIPKSPFDAAKVFVPKPIPPAGTADDPLPLDDLQLEEVSPSGAALDAAALLVEEPVATPFAFDEPPPVVTKKKRRDDDEADRPRKRRKGADAEENRPVKRGSQKKKTGPPWGVIIGVGVLLLALGGGVAAVLLSGGKKDEEAKATTDPLLGESQPKGEPEGGGPGPDDGNPTVPVPVPPEPPPKIDPPPPPPAATTLPPPPTGKIAVVGKVKRTATLDVPADKVRDVRVAGESLVVAFNTQLGFQGVGAKDTLRQYSLATGVKGRELEIDSSGLTWPRAFAVGNAGGLVAVEAGGPGKMTVFDLDTNTVVLDQEDAFAGIANRVGPIAALAVGANRKLFVVDQAGAVDVWDLGSRKRAVTGTPPKRPPTATGKPAAKACAINGGAEVAVALDGKVWAVNASGATVGQSATLPDPTAVPLAIGTGAGPDRAAVAYRLPGGTFGVAAVRPVAGQVEFHTPLPAGAVSPVAVGWPADTLLTVSTGDAGFIVDTEARAVTAYLKAVSGTAPVYPTGGEVWWLLADAKAPAKAVLRSVEMPFDGYFALAKAVRAGGVPVFLIPRPDGLAK